jgi:hypothetical protein
LHSMKQSCRGKTDWSICYVPVPTNKGKEL